MDVPLMSGKGDYGHFTMCVFPCKAIQSLLNAVLSRITLSLIDFLRLPSPLRVVLFRSRQFYSPILCGFL